MTIHGGDQAIEEVKAAIKKILEPLQLKPQHLNELIKVITLSLQKNEHIKISPSTIKNDENTEKMLRTTCLAHVMHNSAELKLDPKFDPNILLKTPDELEQKEEKSLKNTFKDLLKKMFKLTPNGKKNRTPEEEKELEEKMDKLATTLSTELTKNKRQTPLAENKDALDFIASSLQLIYGKDIRFASAPMVTVQSAPEEMSGQNLATTEGTSKASALKQEDGDDPRGIKILTMMNNIAVGEPPTPADLVEIGILPPRSSIPELKPYK